MDERIKQEKSRLRKVLRKTAQSLPEAYIIRSDRAIRENLLALGLWQRTRAVFIYVSIGREIDTRNIIRAALDAGKTVAVPRILGDGAMEARVIASLDGLKPGRLPIPEPDANAPLLLPKDMDLVVAPCVAADRHGWRLGHGGGYYDRYLAAVRCPSTCLYRDRLLLSELPHGEHDRPVDVVVTERDCIAHKSVLR